MPKSKRDRKVSLTQTRKKGLELKQRLVDDIQENVDRFPRIFTFSVENMRNVQLKDVRQEWNHSRFFFGKNKVMSLALGRTCEDEYRENLHKICQHLRGQTGLLFTNKTKKQVLKYFDELRVPDFARSGTVARQTVDIKEGPLPQFSHSMEPQLRQLGLPTCLKKGVITLMKNHTVCDEGDTLTPEQARILKLFGHKMSEFHISIDGMWSNDGSWEALQERPDPVIPTRVTVKPPENVEETEMGIEDEEAVSQNYEKDNVVGDSVVDEEEDEEDSEEDDEEG